MVAKKTLQEREKELQTLLATSAGQEELRRLNSQYRKVSGGLRPPGKSVITAILVHEREKGLIDG